MATKFYLNDFAAPYTPATIRGAWDETAGAVTRQLAQDKIEGGSITTVSRAETVTTLDYDVLLYRGVSGPLTAQTISGTLDVVISVVEGATAADFVWHIHAYVTQGDSDTPRGTLLSDYTETTANEWGTAASTSGKALASAQTVTNVVCSAGDRIVVEIGYRAKNTVTTSFTGTLRYGGDTSTSDLTAGGNGQTLAGFLNFSGTISLASVAARVSQALVEGAIAQGAVAAQVSQALVEGALAQGAVAAQVSQVLVEFAVAAYDPTPLAVGRSQIVIVG